MNITNILRHRYPFLMVDKITEYEYNQKIVGLKYITRNEPWVQGHFPDNPIFPGVYILECMAQTGGLMFCREEGTEDRFAWLAGADKVKFISPVVPGDILRIEAIKKICTQNMAKVSCTVYMENRKTASAEVIYAFEQS